MIIAATGGQKALLEEEFPFLPFVELPGYGVKYGKNRAFTLLKIMAAIPKILIRIKGENAWLKAFQEREKPDAVISDNRYGLHHKGLFSVFITHQLRIPTPFGQRADRMLQRLQYRMLKRFSICWVPDLEEDPEKNSFSLAGDLSQPEELPSIPIRYIGPLSRFEKKNSRMERDGSVGIAGTSMAAGVDHCDLLILLSGPEPQRTIFEKMILGQLAAYPGKVVLVRGLPLGSLPMRQPGMAGGGSLSMSLPGNPEDEAAPIGRPGLIIYPHLAAGLLNEVVCGAGLVLCRPGYSSVMDLLKLGKKCVFVPTPGQTEQEYLGEYLEGRKWALCMPQTAFSLSGALAAAGQFPFAAPEPEGDGPLRAAVGELTRMIAERR